MSLQLIIKADYKRSGSILTVAINGTYGVFQGSRTQKYAKLSITLITAKVLPGSPGKVYFSTLIEEDFTIGIDTTGAFFQDTIPATLGPIKISKKVPNVMHYGEVIVDVYQDVIPERKYIASKSEVFQNNMR